MMPKSRHGFSVDIMLHPIGIDHVIRSTADPLVLITHELFASSAAMQAHNEGDGSKAFFVAAEGLLDDVAIHIGEQVFTL